jgi:magnesium transporter
MRNPLLVPELREMLSANRIDELRDFCEVTPPEMAAEFLGALSPEEQREILDILEPEMRGQVFGYFDEEVKVALLPLARTDQAVDLLGRLDEDDRVKLLERLSDEQQARLREALSDVKPAEARPILEALETAQEPRLPPPPSELTPEEIVSEISEHLEICRFVEGRVERSERLEKGCWVNIVNPTRENLPLIAQHFKIPADFLTASLDLDETARIEVEDNATLFIVKVPYFDEKNIDVLYVTIPIGIILVGNVILTVCPKPGSVLRDFAENKVRNVGRGHHFILQIIMRATLLYLQHLKQLNNAASIIQKKLEQESRNKQLIKLFHIEKSLVYFTTSLKSNMFMLERLKRVRALNMDDANENLLEDIFTECKQAIEMANIYSDILSSMMDAFASVISNNLNIVMKLLTSMTIIITIPVLVASFFGMNVKVPLQDHPHAFLIVMGISVSLSLAAVVYFLRRRWLEP